jgi:glutamate--cysteine ligase
MKLEKYNIKIEREALRIDSRNKKSTKSFPKAFGNKEENDFITADEDESILKIKAPSRIGIQDAYNRFEEIMNVVIEELYKINEYVWPCTTFENEKMHSKITVSINEEFYEEMKALNNNLPEKLEDAYLKIKDNLTSKADLFKLYFGNIKVKSGKSHVQISNIAINHFTKNGITAIDCAVLIAEIFNCLDEDINDDSINKEEMKDIFESQNVKLYIKLLKNEIKRLEAVSKKYSLKLQLDLDSFVEILKLEAPRLIIQENLNKEERISIGKQYAEEGHNTRYCLQKYNKLVAESVVLLKDAIARGINYEVLNETKSVVRFEHKGKKEFAIEGNKTDKDNYIFPIVTDDKYTSKQVMKEAGLHVPNAILLEKDMDEQDKETLLAPFYNTKLVVKPRNTNYGTGITVFAKPANKKQIVNAVNYAFEFDTNVLIEEYVKGMEYRFLVVNGKCISVVHRRTASVVGDGISTIKELIVAKNKEPWHFLTGTPVKMDQPVAEYLSLQGYNYDTVLPKDKRVFLRTNSNCSTGGESIVYTDAMPSHFKRVAEKAARAFDGKICGVDIIIDDINKDDYSIIEINDNPGYSINEWPYEGDGEKIGVEILKLLDLLPKQSKPNK